MKNTILLAIVIAGASLWMGPGFDDSEAFTSPVVPVVLHADNPAVFIDKLVPGLFREVTAYNVGRREQTSGDPCIGATGENLCRLVAKGRRICAANFVAMKTVLNIDGIGECVVLDRMNQRFGHRIDVAMNENEVEKAIEFGVQRRYVEVRPGYP